MFKFLGLTVGIALAAVSGQSPQIPHLVSLSDWHAEQGDRFVVDTAENLGFLVHDDGRYASFPVVTGQRKNVCYIGRCYNATTPVSTWQVKDLSIKGDHLTFGPSGRFFRLFKDGEKNTAYGIHEYGREEEIFASVSRFKSMGCIIVKKDILDIISETYTLNNNMLNVVTKAGVPEPVSTAFAQ